VVPDSDWQKVPADERDAVERQLAAELASVRAELAAATASLARDEALAAPAGRDTHCPPRSHGWWKARGERR